MLKGNRVFGVALGGLIAALLIIAAGWWFQPRLEDIPEPSWKSETEADQQRPNYDSTVICNDDCEVVFDFAESAKTPSGEHNANQRNAGRQSGENWEIALQRRDLLAQERMAHWALWLAGLTAIGVVLIAGTFWEAMEATKAANEAADAARATNDTTREIGEAQARAQVGINWATITFGRIQGASIRPSFRLDPGGPSPTIAIEVENFGPSEAKNFRWDFEVMYFTHILGVIGGRLRERRSATVPPPFSTKSGDSIYPGKTQKYATMHGFNLTTDEESVMRSPNGQASLIVSVLIRFAFEDIFDRTHEDLRRYDLQINPDRLADNVRMHFFPMKELMTQEESKRAYDHS